MQALSSSILYHTYVQVVRGKLSISEEKYWSGTRTGQVGHPSRLRHWGRQKESSVEVDTPGGPVKQSSQQDEQRDGGHDLNYE